MRMQSLFESRVAGENSSYPMVIRVAKPNLMGASLMGGSQHHAAGQIRKFAMSEYQYYEFQAIDRPLGAAEREQLRAISSRARITATSFVNSYDWGDLKADPLKLLERYFDLFLYVANWGTRQFAMRLPKRLLELQVLERFQLDEDLALIHSAGEYVIISVNRDEVEADEWDDGGGRLAGLAPLRTDLLTGDLRLFSLLWLIQVENDRLGDEVIEPAPGLTELSGPLSALADFLAVDPDLLEAAVGTATPLPSSEPSPSAIGAFVRNLPEKDKVALLLRLYSGDDPHLSAELRRLYREDRDPRADKVGPSRTAGDLRAAARRIAQQRKHLAEKRANAERRRRQEAEAQARAKHLSALAKRGEGAWREIEDLIAMRNGSAYDKAATLLLDHREIAAQARKLESFTGRIAELRSRHAKKGQFIARLKAAGL